ncbi:protease prsW family protein [Nitzschia inconspicua]|uniref:Protease prsW family protein n=1 Tax=Nitzschia inconspicua TaxID=303405 RepID=A0A9K3LNB1_9STRA|nr:protease prsW family protein [Nitzschia inconspicua]
MKSIRDALPSRRGGSTADDSTGGEGGDGGFFGSFSGTFTDDAMDYNSFPSGNNLLLMTASEAQPELQKDFRGFNTSIADMWRYPDAVNERIDCCAIACCGCLQADRDRYLMTGKKPPSLCRRIFAHCGLPLIIFGLAIFAAVNVPDPYVNQMLCYGFIFAFIMYFISQCCKGAWKRRQVRRNLLWAKYHQRGTGRFRRRYAEESDEEDDDGHDDDEDDNNYLMGQTRGDVWNAHSLCGCYAVDRGRNFAFVADEEITFCTRLFDCFTNACCAKICGMHFMCCGFCGVAQEGREIQTLLRPEEIHIDYVTMQPMMEYYPAIYEARHSEGRPKSWWFNRLSSFSRWTLINTLIAMALFFVWSLLSRGLNHQFGPKNYLVFVLTFVQALIFLSLVYLKHTKDISIDALVKFFAAGFCLSTTLGVFFELIVGLVIRLTMGVIMAISGVDIVQENGYSMTNQAISWTSGQEVSYEYVGVDYRSYMEAFANDHPFTYTIYLFITSFVLAAMIEEICKYFGYRMVDHPDFHTRRQIEEAARGREEDGVQHTVTSFEFQDRSFKSRGAAITVSMVAVGLGFTCCENLVYIFIYGKAKLAAEVFILLARSLFPIHPIAAAIQSIGVCKRDLERDPKVRLGRIVAPAIIFHGMFDFSVTWFDYIANRKGNFVDKVDTVNTLSSVVSILILLSGVCYYFREARKQRQRLAEMDGESGADTSQLT